MTSQWYLQKDPLFWVKKEIKKEEKLAGQSKHHPPPQSFKAPSTRIRIFSNPQLFLSGYGYRPHESGEFDSESRKK